MKIKDESTKILPLEVIGRLAEQFRQQGKAVVLCHGTFDLLHPGHLRHLQRARQEGDLLMVTITADSFVRKGPDRPIFPDVLRAESLAALTFVDYVAIVHDTTGLPAIQAIHPHVYVKGADYKHTNEDVTGNILLENDAVTSRGGRVHYTDEISFSSSKLINKYLNAFSEDVKLYLDQFKEVHQERSLIDSIQSLKKLKVLVIGEAIIDEYCYASPMGLTGKGTLVLACRFDSSEKFAGGALAIANHLADFAAEVTLVTGVGRNDPNDEFIHSKLSSNINKEFFYYENAPTILKRRYVDTHINKLFEMYYYDAKPLTHKVEHSIIQWLLANASRFDAVIVADYGNGFLSADIVAALCSHSRFLAVNTQMNSGNYCHHVITRYSKADFISLNEPEVRLVAHSKTDPLVPMAQKIGQQLQARWFAITRGTDGAMMLDLAKGESLKIPALTTSVVDRIGAGDAFLSFGGLSLAGGLPPDVALFLGSAAAALNVQTICNREAVRATSLLKYVSTLMK